MPTSSATPVPSEKISVILQGPIDRDPGLSASVDFIHRSLPHCELIVSTWEGSEISGDPAIDLLIENADPGVSSSCFDRHIGNVNRQIVSTVAGLKATTRPYALKLRVDTPIEAATLCTSAPIERLGIYAILSEKISMTNLAFRDHLEIDLLFHPSDIVQFGRREDLLDFWDIPLFDEQFWTPLNGHPLDIAGAIYGDTVVAQAWPCNGVI